MTTTMNARTDIIRPIKTVIIHTKNEKKEF